MAVALVRGSWPAACDTADSTSAYMAVAWASPWARSTGVQPHVGLEGRPRVGPSVGAGPVQLDVLLPGASPRGQGLGPGDEDTGTAPRRHELGGAVHEPLGDRPPHPRAARLGVRGADAPGELGGGVAVAEGQRVDHEEMRQVA